MKNGNIKFFKKMLALVLVIALTMQMSISVFAGNNSAEKKNFKDTMTIGKEKYSIEKITDDKTGTVKVLVTDEEGILTITDFNQIGDNAKATVTKYKTNSKGNKIEIESKKYEFNKKDVEAQSSYSYNAIKRDSTF